MSKVQVKRGQVWRDRSVLDRVVTVVSWDRWEGAPHVVVVNARGRKTRIRLDRFDGRQYVLVEDKDG